MTCCCWGRAAFFCGAKINYYAYDSTFLGAYNPDLLVSLEHYSSDGEQPPFFFPFFGCLFKCTIVCGRSLVGEI